MYRVCINGPETLKLDLATLILEFGTAKPSCVITVGRTVKASTNIQLVRTGLVKSVDYERGDRMNWFSPAPGTRLVAQAGKIIVHRCTAKTRLNIAIISVFSVCILCIYV
jgi:hypothetical protein